MSWSVELLICLFILHHSGENADICGDLMKILSECQQEVPDFLKNGGSGGGMGGDGGFGGVDIRGGQAVQMNAADDDEW